MNFKGNNRAQYDHAPGADLDYGFDWKANHWLEDGEMVIDSAWSVTGDIIMSRQQIDGGAVTSVFVAGGKVGQTYKLINSIVTSSGRKDSRTITITCKQR
jgi:hypothetical protein